MGTAHAGKPPSLPRELRTPLGFLRGLIFYVDIDISGLIDSYIYVISI
jgi:hypothetical protein